MSRLIEVGRQSGVERLVGRILRENANMLKMAKELGFRVKPTDDPMVVQAELDLAK
jgi:acetyltransferase